MWPRGAPGASAKCDDLTAFNLGSFCDFELRQMHIERHEAKAVVNDDAVAFVIERACEYDAAGVNGGDGSAGFGAVVEAAVHAGECAIEDATCAEGIGPGSDAQRSREAAGPDGVGRGTGEGFVFDDLVGGDDLLRLSVGLNEFFRDSEGNFFVRCSSDRDIALESVADAVSVLDFDGKRVAARSDFHVNAA